MLAHLRSNVVAYLALFVALTGTAVAATKLPKNSVGPKQIQKKAVTRTKIKPNAVSGTQVAEQTLGEVPSAAHARDADTVGGQVPATFLAAGGKAVDADKLDGIDSAVFGSVQTYTGTVFEPVDTTATQKASTGTGAINCTGSPTSFVHRVELPQGARVTKLEYRFVDDAAAVNTGLELRGYDQFGIGGLVTIDVASTTSVGFDDPARHTTSVDLAEPHVIDNAHYAYLLVWSPVVCNADSQLAGAAVHYAMPQG